MKGAKSKSDNSQHDSQRFRLICEAGERIVIFRLDPFVGFNIALLVSYAMIQETFLPSDFLPHNEDA